MNKQFYADELHTEAVIGLHNRVSIKKGHIFVSVASYRDDRCSSTVNSLFKKAARPGRIWVGICQQNDQEDPDCISAKAITYKSHIKINRISSLGAKGPTWARYLCSRLWEGQEFFLQIDSHTQFAQNWDVDLIDMYNKIGMRKIVLTHYPPAHDVFNTDEKLKSKTAVTNGASVNNKNQLISSGKIIPKISFPKETKYFSAGLLFAPYEFLIEIPYDPYLPYLFQGEEPMIAMRLYTRGWKMFNPSHCVANHYYDRKDSPKFWTDHQAEYKEYNPLSAKRSRFFLGLEDKDPFVNQEIYKYYETYGPKNRKSLNNWHSQLDVDWKKRVRESKKSK